MTTIRKAVITEFGDANVVQVQTATIAEPAKGEVQVSVIYSGFSGADINMRKGIYPMQQKAPLTPGYCFVGRVKANGPGSSLYAPGTLVAAMSMYDSEAELINQPEKYLVPVPEGVDLKQVAPLVLDWSTAYAMVHDTAKECVGKGKRVFVHGVSGSVGLAVAKLSQLQGAEVYGTASARNHDAVRAAGVTPFEYKNKDWIAAMQALGGAHAVFDPLGFESWDESHSILNDDSILIGYGNNLQSLSEDAKPRSVILPTLKLFARGWAPFCKKRTTFYFIAKDHATFRPNLLTLFDMLARGEIAVPIKQVWDLEHVKDAHLQWSNGNGIGSLLIKVGSE